MTNVYLTSSSTAGNNITLANNVDAFIGAGVNRASTGNFGILAQFQSHGIQIQGHVFGDTAGILLGASSSAYTNSRIDVGVGASVTGRSDAIRSLGSAVSIANAGHISGNEGIVHTGASFALSNSGTITGSFGSALNIDSSIGEIRNTGTITSSYNGNGISLNNSEQVNGVAAAVINFGTISGYFRGVRGASSDSNTIVNYGTIEGLSLGNQSDTVTNGGLITGTLNMASGNDTYTGIADGIVDGIIDGSFGNDTLTGGDLRDRIFGGADNDILQGGDGRDRIDGGSGDDTILADADGHNDRFFGGSGTDTLSFEEVADDLTIKASRGVVKSDETGVDRFAGFEAIAGGSGDDTMIGNATVTTLLGGAGNDSLRGAGTADDLSGEEGNDTLRGRGGGDLLDGGTGNDSLSGNGGADIFVFGDGFGRDVITDFAETNNAEKIDLSNVTAITDIADLRADHLSQRGNDAWIVDGGNRIVLKNVDTSDLQNADFIF